MATNDPKLSKGKPASGGKKWRSYLRTLAVLNILTVVIPGAYYFAIALQSWLRPGSGYEYTLLVVAPTLSALTIAGYAVAVINIVSILLYLRSARPARGKVVVGLLVVALSLGYLVVSMVTIYRQSRLVHDSQVMLSEDATAALINTCQVARIENRRPYGGASQVTAREDARADEFAYRQTRASDMAFDDLKALAQTASERCGGIKLQE